MTIYFISPDIPFIPTEEEWVEQIEKLTQAITRLARKSTEEVRFHAYKDAGHVSHGDKHILIECSENFLAAVQKLPNFFSSRIFDPHKDPLIETVSAKPLPAAKIKRTVQKLAPRSPSKLSA